MIQGYKNSHHKDQKGVQTVCFSFVNFEITLFSKMMSNSQNSMISFVYIDLQPKSFPSLENSTVGLIYYLLPWQMFTSLNEPISK